MAKIGTHQLDIARPAKGLTVPIRVNPQLIR